MSPEIARKVVVTFRGLLPGDKKDPRALDPARRDSASSWRGDTATESCANLLGVSIDTIRFHVRNIYERLHVNSRAEAVWKAYGTIR